MRATRLRSYARSHPLAIAALVLIVIKCAEFLIDSRLLFCSDSGGFFANALRIAFIPFRSYVYGYLIREFALPFRSLRMLVAMQLAMGALTGWLLAFVLIRYFKVRGWIAIATAALFAIDPVQVLHEHMAMTETTALLVVALLLCTSLEYLRRPFLWLLIVFAFLGAILVSLRVVYVPVVIAGAVLLPLGAHWRRIVSHPALTLAALIASCASTAAFQIGYQHLTGWLGRGEPGYTGQSGFFLLATVSPIVVPENTSDPRVAQAIAAQNQSSCPLQWRCRGNQLWSPEGLVSRLRAAFRQDGRQANLAARQLAMAAIRRRPAGFARLAVRSYLRYWTSLGNIRNLMPIENGSAAPARLLPSDASAIRAAFGRDVSNGYMIQTRTRKYIQRAAYWYVFLLLAPFLTAFAAWRSPAARDATVLLFVWECLLLTATNFGTTDIVYRYLHPFSFTCLAALAIVCNARAQKRPLDTPPVRSEP